MKRRSQEVIMEELWQAHVTLEAFKKVAKNLPKKLYTKRKSHKRANFIAKKTGKPRQSKHNFFFIKVLQAQMKFNALQDEWIDSNRNFTMKDALANKA